MPPRKKASASGVASVPTRASTRNKAASTIQTPVAPVAVKPKSKRVRAKDPESGDDAPSSKPASKKVKRDETDDKDDEDTTEKPTDEPKKMVTVIKRGAAPVDPFSGKVNTHQVYSNEQGVWDAMLNQTDVSGYSNKNKYYVLQLLHPIGNNSQSYLYTRWGRVGEEGQSQSKGPWPAATAINEFKKQFKAKAAVAWDDRVGMTAKKGKYTWIERDYNDDDDDTKGNGEGSKKEDVIVPDSTLESEIQELCRLIFSTTFIDAHLSSMNYDANKLPLGKLAKSTILNGFAALKTLAEVIEKPDGEKAQEYGGLRSACEQLSGAYYSIIPHDFGRQRPIVIDTLGLLKTELDLVDALGDMEIASKLISSTIPTDDSGNPINPLDANFRSLGLSSMKPVRNDSKEFGALEAYVRNTHGATHQYYQVRVMNAYRVERAKETENWNTKGYGNLNDGERLLLWHGSRTTNFAGILKQGLRIAPPEAPVTGYMFGKGVYFADMMSKSANYCYSYLSGNTGLLLLCEVIARPFHELAQGDYDADKGCKANGKMATKGIGRTQPVDWQDAGEALGNDELIGCQMPASPAKDLNLPNVYLQYNEYIVYDASQIRVKYLLMVNM